MAMVYYRQRKWCIGQCLRETWHKLLESFPGRVTHLIPPVMSCDRCEMFLEAQHQEFFFGGDGHESTLCLAYIKITHSQKKGGVHHQLYYLYKQFRHNEPFISSGNGGNPPEIQVPSLPLTHHVFEQTTVTFLYLLF